MTLGWRPKMLLIKRADDTGDWHVIDQVRGMAAGNDAIVTLNTLAAETTADVVDPTSTGFAITTDDADFNADEGTYIYMAIRR